MRKFEHISAKTVKEASEALAKYGARKAYVNAGGTDLIGTLRNNVLDDYPEAIIDLKTIEPSLDYIKVEGGVLKIGALAKLEDIAESDTVKKSWGALAEAAHRTASPHLREAGTIGGNICQMNRCWYFRKHNNRFFCIRKGGSECFAPAGENRIHSIFGISDGKMCFAVNPSDTAPALVAYNASIVTNKRTIEAEKFWKVTVPGSTVLDQDEIVTEIQVPAFSGKACFKKMAVRASIDFPIVNCCSAYDGSNWRICLNAVSGNPRRCTEAEEAMKGKSISDDTAKAAGEAAVAKANAMSCNSYKIHIAKGLIKQTILACK